MSGGDWFLVLVIGAFTFLGGILAFASWDEVRTRDTRRH